MAEIKDSYQVGIVGGGPVGMFLAIALLQEGIDCIVFEKRSEPITHSKSLGIHPVSLELFDKAGIVDDFLDEGIRIRRGLAYNDRGKIGTISFQSCPKPYNYILSLPQYRTEALLEKKLRKADPACLLRGVEVKGFTPKPDHVEVNLKQDNLEKVIRCDFLVGCDGKDSLVREQAGFSFDGSSYPDTYIMGDFADNTIFENDAVIFLCSEGLIESFPLNGNQRRWVIKTDRYMEEADRTDFEKIVARRIGHDLGEVENFMISCFGVQKYVAKPMAQGRIFLAGDAAHIVSPIGGQGMNLGWLDTWNLKNTIKKGVSDPAMIGELAKKYSSQRTKIARKVISRAELNMKLGRKRLIPQLRNGMVWIMLNTPIKYLMAKMFTMRGLNSWPV